MFGLWRGGVLVTTMAVPPIFLVILQLPISVHRLLMVTLIPRGHVGTSCRRVRPAACSTLAPLQLLVPDPSVFPPMLSSPSVLCTDTPPPPHPSPHLCTCLSPHAPLFVCRERHRYQWQQVRPPHSRCLSSSPSYTDFLWCHQLECTHMTTLPPPPPPPPHTPHLTTFILEDHLLPLPPLPLLTVINVATELRTPFPGAHLNVNFFFCLEPVSATIRTQENATVCRQRF